MAEAQLKTFGLTACAEEISRRPNVGCVVWLSVVTLMEIRNEKEPSYQGKLQKMQFEGTMKCHGAEASAQVDKEFKEKPDDK